MREPTTLAARWRWWECAVQGREVHHQEEDPQCGFYKVRKFRYGEWPKGPWLPARVWMEPQEIDPETGELLSDEIFKMTIDGKHVDPWHNWTRLSRKPILETEWKWLTAMSPLRAQRIPQLA